MEFTLESALSPGGLLGHSTYLLLVLSMALKRLFWIRIVVICSALVGISYSYFMLSDPVGVFWESLLITVNLVRLSIDNLRDRSARFTAEEKALADEVFSCLSPASRRRLIDAGQWADCPSGMCLSRQGEVVTHLTWLAEGKAEIAIDGAIASYAGAGDLIGELTVLDGEPATATVRLDTSSRVWRIEAAVLRRLADKKPEIRTGLDAAFTSEMRRKLKRAPRNFSGVAAFALG